MTRRPSPQDLEILIPQWQAARDIIRRWRIGDNLDDLAAIIVLKIIAITWRQVSEVLEPKETTVLYPDILTAARLVRPLAAELTAAGVQPDIQLRIFRTVLGISVGSGGGGPDASIVACPYCGAHGGGGHGGFCPNGIPS